MQRDTAQRRLIRRLLREANRPLAPREVMSLAQAQRHRLGLATIYRNLNALTREGWLVPVELPGESTRYELSGKGHHHHFRCRVCTGVFEIDGCALRLDHTIPRGFKVESHEIILYGQCAACSAPKPRPAPRSAPRPARREI